jgi:uncharacterized protein HemX
VPGNHKTIREWNRRAIAGGTNSECVAVMAAYESGAATTPAKRKRKDPTVGILLILLALLLGACALLWISLQNLKRSADPYASTSQLGSLTASRLTPGCSLPARPGRLPAA